MNLLVISNYRDPVSTRPEAELFIRLHRQGVRVTIMTYPDAGYIHRFREMGLRVIPFHPEKKRHGPSIQRIRQELIEGKYDLLHLFNSKAITNGIPAAKGLSVKVILYRGYTGNIHWYDPTAYWKYLHPRVDGIMCLADSVREHIQGNMFFGDKNKAVTINKGHDPDWYASIEPLDLTELGIPRGAFTLACVANNRRMKGIPYLLEATHRIPVELPIHLILVGNGMDIPPLRKIRQRSPNRAKIHLPGFRKDALQIVKAANAFVLPSIKGEATTKALLEAMSLGVAPIITDISGNRGVVLQQENGLVVPARDPAQLARAMVYLYEHPELCREYGEKASEHIRRRFHIDRTVSELKSFYEALLR